MLRKLLEQKGTKLTDSEFATVMEMTTDDIKFNNTTFGKKTSLIEVLDVAERSADIVRRYCH